MHKQAEAQADRENDAQRVLDERRVENELQYLVEWQGQDSTTGDDYEPTWVSLSSIACWIRQLTFEIYVQTLMDDIAEGLIEAYRERKAAERQRRKSAASAKTSPVTARKSTASTARQV